jgi:hypothetical protein
MVAGISPTFSCSTHSDHLVGVYEALFAGNDLEDVEADIEEPQPELAIAGRWEGLLHLHWLEIDARYRHSGVVPLAIETAIRHFCPGGLVTAYSGVLDLSMEEWTSLGFRKIADSEVVYRDNTAGDPYGHPLQEEE